MRIEGVLLSTGSTPSSTARHHARHRGRQAPAPASWQSGPDSSPTQRWRRPCVRVITTKDSPHHPNRPGRGRISPGNQGQESRDSRISSSTGVARSSRSPCAPQGRPSRWLHTARCTGEADAPPPSHGRSTASCSALQMLTHGHNTAQLPFCCVQL
jgi:hypothetical protein